MKRLKYVLIFFVIIKINFAQVPADSLPGQYAGIFQSKKSTDTSWTIFADTLQINNIDSSTCQIISMQATCCFAPSLPASFYTQYLAFCNGNPTNQFYMFYSGDSLKMIANNIPQSPPNPTMDYHFYGKRINNITTGVLSHNAHNELNVLPNPCNDFLFVEGGLTEGIIFCEFINSHGVKYAIELTPLDEKKIYRLSLNDRASGIYFLLIKLENNFTTTRKILISK